MTFTKYILLLCGALLMTGRLMAASKPYIANFTRDKYHAANKNWAAGQDEKGIMYFGNDLGLLESDGMDWELYPMPGQPIVRALAVESHRTIYTGGDGELGRWDRQLSGKLAYSSLTHLLPKESQSTNESIWRIWIKGERVYFQSFSNIYIYDQHHIRRLTIPKGFLFLQKVRDEYWVQEMYSSLYQVTKGTLHKAEGSDFLNGRLARVILPYGDDKYLIGTSDGQLHVYDGTAFTPWNPDLDRAFKGKELNCGIYCDKRGSYYFGTLLDGIYEVDAKGNITNHFHAYNALQNNTVLSLYEDRRHNIWATMDRGLACLRYTNGLSYYLSTTNNASAVYAATRWKNLLLIGTNQGVFYISAEKACDWEFFSSLKLIPGTEGQVWNFHQTDGKLYCCHNSGLLQIHPDLGISAVPGIDTGVFQVEEGIINNVPLLIILGYNKVCILNKQSGRLTTLKQISDLRHAAIDHLGNIWLGTTNRGVYKCRLNENMDAFRYYTYYGHKTDKSLPKKFKLLKTNGRILFLGNNRFYSYDENKDCFQPNPLLNECFKSIGNLREIIPANNEEGWAITTTSVFRFFYDGYIARIKEAYQIETEHVALVTNYENISILNDSLSLICLDAGFILHNSRKSQRQNIRIVPPNVEFIHAGQQAGEGYAPFPESLSFPYKDNTVTFGFSIDNALTGNLRVQYQLNHVDSGWSRPVSINRLSYARLPQGDYTLRLRATDGLGNYSTETHVPFKILPPWYLTHWWYAACCLLAALVFATTFWLMKRHLQQVNLRRMKMQEAEYLHKLNEQLQNEIEEKNAELFTQTSFIIHKNELMLKLKEMIDQISSKNTQKSLIPLYLKVNNLLTSNLNSEDDWKMFLIKFEQKHRNFFKILKEAYPALTTNDLRLCACLKLNMDTKDIASLMNLSIRAVENNRYRLRKKLDLKPAQNLNDFFLSIG